MEKRHNRRHDCEVFMTCSYFNKKESHPARVRNYNESGVYLECNEFFKSGSTVLLRMERFVASDSGTEYCCGPRIISLGQVTWCREMTEGDSPSFSMGIQYLSPIGY
jgi:hypothetical protein